MKIEHGPIPGLLVIKPKLFGDDRGYFQETWNKEQYAKEGLDVDFVQDNISFSRKGILRGLHFQNPGSQGKLVYVLQGEVFDVAVDVRVDSPTFGLWYGVILSETNRHQFFIPEGFAHGFCVTSDTALFAYKCTSSYSPQSEHSLLWNDPDVGIEWPTKDPQLSEKDKNGVLLNEFDPKVLSF